MSLLRLSALTLATGSLAWAQVDAGTVTGTVRDASGAVIPGATVSIECTGTGLKIGTSTGAPGVYVSPPLRPGVYTMVVRGAGFEPSAKHFAFEVNHRAAIDFALSVGAVTDVVEVVDVTPVLQAESESVLRTAVQNFVAHYLPNAIIKALKTDSCNRKQASTQARSSDGNVWAAC